ncbi:MAG: short-chain dehydrogenase/reductase [Gemmatimonadetes bacterium]|nr:short-chain dehydrogenase/reductase [Gemmatimonadota bacterium]
MIDLRGKRALVTGGSRGIGAATARMLARAGADVMIGYRSRAAEAEEIVAQLASFGVRARAHPADLATREGAESLVAATVAAFGGLELYVGNAGIWPEEEVPVTELDDARWHRTMRENVDSIFYTTRAVARVISDHGRIVLISSTAGQRGESFHADYGASKGAVISFTKSLAVELAPRDVTVNSVAPGWVDTEMVAGALQDEARARANAGIPLGRIASPDDIAGPIVFLCSPLARHVTGEILNVNGGSVLCG